MTSAERPVLCVVESDRAVLDSLDSVLSLHGVDVRTFASGRRLRREWPLALRPPILCAAELSDTRGIELYRWLCRVSPPSAFALSLSRHQSHLLESARLQGIEHLFFKPLLAPEQLLAFTLKHQSAARKPHEL